MEPLQAYQRAAALKGERGDTAHDPAESSGPDSDSSKDGAINNADAERRRDDSEGSSASRSDGNNTSDSSRTLQDKQTEGDAHTNVPADTARKESYDAPPDTWLGMLPALKDGPQQDKEA
jgi:platelet-activating factor acetylhydrolase